MESEFHYRFDLIEKKLNELLDTKTKEGKIITTYEVVEDILEEVKLFRLKASTY